MEQVGLRFATMQQNLKMKIHNMEVANLTYYGTGTLVGLKTQALVMARYFLIM